MKKVIILGAGLGGISTAIYLRKYGYEVEIFEKNKRPGGKAAYIEEDGFYFDKGPSLVTMKDIFEELFAIHGEDLDDWINFLPLEIIFRYFFPNGKQIDGISDVQGFADKAQEIFGEPKENVYNFFSKTEFKYTKLESNFLNKPFQSMLDLISKDFIEVLLKPKESEYLKSVHQANKDTFNNQELVKIFDRFATYIGVNPFQAPAFINLIPYLEFVQGAYYLKGGFYELIDKIYKLSLKVGVKYSFQEEIKKVEIKDREIQGIYSSRGFEECDILVNNTDYNFFNAEILGEKKKKIENKKNFSTSAIIFYWGVSIDSSKKLDIHNILFTKDYEEEFKYIFDNKKISDDPTVYIYISSKFNKEHAPQSHENWYVMINTPPDFGQDWESEVKKLKKRVLEKIKSILGYDLDGKIVFERVASPPSIRKDTNSYRGSIYGELKNNPYLSFLRHSNKSKRHKNLYYAGGSVHPGGGTPIVTSSGKITAKLIHANEK